MTSKRAMKQAGLAVAVAMALCVMSSPSGATAIWGIGRRAAVFSASSASSDAGRAGWRLNDGSRAGWRLNEGSRAGWRLIALVQAMRAGW